MERQKKVLDASVMVKWFADEERREQAIALREKHIAGEIEIVIPEAALLEIENALRYKKKSEEELKKAATDLFDMQLTQILLDESLLHKTIDFSLKHSLPIYDALYAAVAQLHGAPLITADMLLSKVPNAIALEKT